MPFDASAAGQLQPASVRRSPAPADLLAALEHGDAITAAAAAVVAHPDDETISLGSRLSRLRALELVQVTDGAPLDPADALHAGFPDADSYRLARDREVQAALKVLRARPRRRGLGVRDQEAVRSLPQMVAALMPLLARVRIVLTHAYEGGHPDHDACACAVQLACERLRARGRPSPVRVEFASYHLAGEDQVSGDFWADDAHPVVRAEMTAADLERKTAAFGAFASQVEVMGWFSPEVERFRLAPTYNFTQPPPPGRALYDRFGWSLTSAVWRREAAAAMEAMETS
jgi:N-acetylglucosamine malate deacetylase 2